MQKLTFTIQTKSSLKKVTFQPEVPISTTLYDAFPSLNTNSPPPLFTDSKRTVTIDTSKNGSTLTNYKRNLFFLDLNVKLNDSNIIASKKVEVDLRENWDRTKFSHRKFLPLLSVYEREVKTGKEFRDYSIKKFMNCPCKEIEKQKCQLCTQPIPIKFQEYRNVDHVTFNSKLISKLLNFDGLILLTGFYRKIDDPLNGTEAIVDGFYIPDQKIIQSQNEAGFKLLENTPKIPNFVERILEKSDRKIVGMLFKSKGEFLSPLEMIFIAEYQRFYNLPIKSLENEYKNREENTKNKNSFDRKFKEQSDYNTSLFFTAVIKEVEGTKNIEIYQLNDEFVDALKENLLLPVKDKEIFLGKREFLFNENKELKTTKEIPIFPFLIPVPSGQKELNNFFISNNFLLQSTDKIFRLKKYFSEFKVDSINAFRNLNLLHSIENRLTTEFSIDEIVGILRNNKVESINKFTEKNKDLLPTVETEWNCGVCTYKNKGIAHRECEMCGNSR